MKRALSISITILLLFLIVFLLILVLEEKIARVVGKVFLGVLT